MAGTYTQDAARMYDSHTTQLKFTYRWDENDKNELARINCFCRPVMIPTIMDFLSEEDKTKVRNGPFAPLIHMSTRLKMSNQVIHFMLMREVKTRRKHSMWFGINNVLIRFGLTEFSDITGLNCSDDSGHSIDDLPDVDMKRVVGIEICTTKDLEEIYARTPKESSQKLKMALMLLIETVVVAKDRKTMVYQQTINIVNDMGMFNSIPLGRLAFNQTMRFFQSCEAGKERPSGGYNIGGFPLALQIWLFHSVPKLAHYYASINDEEAEPMCLRYVSRSGKSGKPFPGYAEIKGIVDNLKKEDIKTVEGLIENDDTDWWPIEGEDDRIDFLFDNGFQDAEVIITRPSEVNAKEETFRVGSSSVVIRNIGAVIGAVEADDDAFVDPPKKNEEDKQSRKRKPDANIHNVQTKRASNRTTKGKDPIQPSTDEHRQSPIELKKNEKVEAKVNMSVEGKVYERTRASNRTTKGKEIAQPSTDENTQSPTEVKKNEKVEGEVNLSVEGKVYERTRSSKRISKGKDPIIPSSIEEAHAQSVDNVKEKTNVEVAKSFDAKVQEQTRSSKMTTKEKDNIQQSINEDTLTPPPKIATENISVDIGKSGEDKINAHTRSSRSKTKEKEKNDQSNVEAYPTLSPKKNIDEVIVEEGRKGEHKSNVPMRMDTHKPTWVVELMDKLDTIQRDQKEIAEKVEHHGIMIEELTTYTRDLGTLYDKMDTTIYQSCKRTEIKIKNIITENVKKSTAPEQAPTRADVDKEDIIDDAKIEELGGGSSEV